MITPKQYRNRIESHRLLLQATRKALGLSTRRIFQEVYKHLKGQKGGDVVAFEKWQYKPILPEPVYNFCLDTMCPPKVKDNKDKTKRKAKQRG